MPISGNRVTVSNTAKGSGTKWYIFGSINRCKKIKYCLWHSLEQRYEIVATKYLTIQTRLQSDFLILSRKEAYDVFFFPHYFFVVRKYKHCNTLLCLHLYRCYCHQRTWNINRSERYILSVLSSNHIPCYNCLYWGKENQTKYTVQFL